MKRSCSMVQYQTPKPITKSYTSNETAIPEVSPQQIPGTIQTKTADIRSKANSDFFISPISLTSLTKKVNSKILTSDFWPNSMKLKMRRISEIKLPYITSERKLNFMQIEGSSDVTKGFGKSIIESVGIRNRIHLENTSNLNHIDRIISDCKIEILSNHKLGKELIRVRKSIQGKINLN